MNSIRKKLFVQIGALILLFIVLLFLANTYILPSYFVYTQKKQLFENFKIINDMNGNYEENFTTFRHMENTSNINILIYTGYNDIKYNSRPMRLEKKLKNKPLALETLPTKPPLRIRNEEQITNNTTLIWGEDMMAGGNALILTGLLDNGDQFDLVISYQSITSTVALMNNFILAVGLIIFILSILLAFLISKHFTEPILNMNRITSKMKNLDFTGKCDVRTKDELEQLATSINDMSKELSQTMDSLTITNAKLQQEIKEKTKIDNKRKQLLSNVSHELKTPLSLMQGYAEGLKFNVAKNRERTDFYCDVIVDETKKMTTLVESLLNINQLEFGDSTLHKTVFDALDFVSYILEKYMPLFREQGIDFDSSLLETAWDVHADAYLSEQVITNYLNNALRYVDEHKVIRLHMTETKDSIRVHIYNSCQFDDREQLDKLWDSFYKGDVSRKREENSYGLGLSIVKAIQEASHNDYGVQLKDEGLEFWFDMEKEKPASTN